MMVNIVKLQLFIVLSILLHCRSPIGPVFLLHKNLGNLRDIVPYINPRQKFIAYTFSQYNHIFKENALGELIITEKTYKENQMIVSKLTFLLRSISYNRNHHIRIRIYKGIVYYDQNTKLLDLHAENCYTYAKEKISDRLYPIEGWTCDHLVWIFKNEITHLILVKNNNEILNSQKSKRIEYSQWMFLSNPKLYEYSRFREPVWFGTFLEEKDDSLVFFGYNANVYFSNNDFIYNFKNNLPLSIKEVIGDFVIIDKKSIKNAKLNPEEVVYALIKKESTLF